MADLVQIEGKVLRPHPVNSPLTVRALKGPLAGAMLGQEMARKLRREGEPDPDCPDCLGEGGYVYSFEPYGAHACRCTYTEADLAALTRPADGAPE